MEPVFCPKCGQKHTHDYLYCYCLSCGTRITARHNVLHSPPQTPQFAESRSNGSNIRTVNAQKVLIYGLLSSFITLRFIWLTFNPRPGASFVLLELLLIVIGPSLGVVGLLKMSKSQVVGNKYAKICARILLWISTIIGGLILAFIVLLILAGG